jgi:hypothetical protein
MVRDWRRRLSQRCRRLMRPPWLMLFGRTQPVSANWGLDRGRSIDRHYIEHFLAQHRGDIRGRVLEVKDPTYVDRFGTGVEQTDVIDIDASNPRATIVADLSAATQVPANSYDCFILTQTLHLIYDLPAALLHVHRIVRPGGVVLATAPAVSQIMQRYGLNGDYWRFTPASCEMLFRSAFGGGNVMVRSYGNASTGAAFLLGMASEELPRRSLETHDPYFPVVVAIRAVKAA